MTSTFTPSVHLEKPANGDDVDTWDVPVNADWDTIDAVFGNTTTINAVAASGTVTLTFTQYRPRMFVISGLLTANVNYQLPSGVGGQFTILNSTTGAFTITFSSAGGGTTVLLPQGKRTNVLSDGTNISVGGAQAGANADITSLTGLTTPLAIGEGGTGVAAAGGTVYAANNVSSVFTAEQGFAGTSTNLAALLANAAEIATVSGTAATGTIAIYLASQSVLYFTTNASANWIVNISLSAGTTLNAAMSSGQCVTLVFMVTQGATAFYNAAVQVDGTTSGVTTKWQGGAPTFGNPGGVDVYSYALIKTATSTWSVLASVTQFK